MTDVPKKLVSDISNGTQMYVDMTPEEIEQNELAAIAAATAKSEQEAADAAFAELKASAKAKLVAGQSLTEEEAATIVL